MQGAADLGSREPWEVFYAAPSVTATAFLVSAAEGARTVASEQSVPAALRLADLTTLARTVMVQSVLLSGMRRVCTGGNVVPDGLNIILPYSNGSQYT